MSSIYATPEADLRNEIPSDRTGGSVEDAIAGNVEISMNATMGEAWRNMKGFKLKCHIALLIYTVVAIAFAFIGEPVTFGMTALGADLSIAAIVGGVIQSLAGFAIYPMFLGIHIMGMRHARNKTLSVGSTFGYFHKAPAIILCYIIMMLMVMLGTVLLILPGIYLLIAYTFAMPLVVEKNMSAWRALETSRKALTRKWFPILGVLLLILIVNMLAILTLGIAWIWTIPWSVLTMSMIYTKLFGAEPLTLAD